MNENNINDSEEASKPNSDFIRTIIDKELQANKHKKIVTRFPPEPNGFLHIGHAKSIVLNFGIAKEYNGVCHLRLDDTNPEKEDNIYVEAIKQDVKWLGYNWDEHLYFPSDYYDKLYDFAVILMEKGKAYVDSLSEDDIKKYRGTAEKTKDGKPKPGKDSPYRNRSIKENLSLFREMADGQFKDGEHVLRAKIDMNSPNLNMRDPVLYRIKHISHYRAGNKWCIYPMYDFAHCLSDAIEGISHSLCTLEFETNRPLYDWIINELELGCKPQQIEFARLNISNTVLSKRKLIKLVSENHVNGWDDPRMPTISGLRRRGYTPQSIIDFCKRIGISKTHSTVDINLLEHCIREDLNKNANRVMAVIDPLKVIITNYPTDEVEWLEADNNQGNPNAGKRKIPFSKEIYIEKNDFMENPPKKFFRLSPGSEVRLQHAYYIKCESYKKDEETGAILEVYCSYDPNSKGGWSKDGRKVKGTSHWVSAAQSVKVRVNLYDHFFIDNKSNDFIDNINTGSLKVVNNCLVEPSIQDAKPGDNFQFLRQGYFCVDKESLSPNKMVFNQTVSLKSTWNKKKNKQ
jgi:glutaminyl-tRNA synthetase